MADLTDPFEVDKAAKDLEASSRQWLEDLRAMLATPGGKRVLARLLVKAGVMSESGALRQEVHLNSTNDIIFAMGQKSIGTWLFNEAAKADRDTAMRIIANNE